MSDPDQFISEEEAARVWQRAAELQSEAARRMEARGAGGTEVGPPASHDGFALAHVRAAATEAGIGAEFVEAALADLRADQAALREVGDGEKRLARAVLGDPPPGVSARRTIDAPVESVLEALEELLPRAPYELVLKDRLGDPAGGGVLVFDIPGATMTPTNEKGFVLDASWADLREVYLTVRPLPDGATEVSVRSPVAWAWNINAGFAPVMAGFGGVAGGLGGALLGAAAALVLPEAAQAVAQGLALALGGGAGVYGGLWGLRAIYGSGQRRGRKALEGMLAAVATQATGGWGLIPGGGPREQVSDVRTLAEGQTEVGGGSPG